MRPYLNALKFIAIAYVINLVLRGQNSPQSSAVSNCLRYTQNTAPIRHAFLNLPLTQGDPILNRNNIAAFLGAPGPDCDFFVDRIMEAYSRGKLTQGLFKIVFGLNHDFKVGVDKNVRSKDGLIGALYHPAQTILIERLDEPLDLESAREKLLHYPANLLAHEFLHEFIALLEKNGGGPLLNSGFYAKAKAEFKRSMERIDKISKLYDASSLSPEDKRFLDNEFAIINQYSVSGMENFNRVFAFFTAVDVINIQLQQNYASASKAIQVQEMFAHLLQMIPEELIARYFPFFYESLEKMIKHFDGFPLSPYSGTLPEDVMYTYDYVSEKTRCAQLAQDLSGREFDVLYHNVQYQMRHHMRAEIEHAISRFETDRSKCALNILQKTDPSHYALGNRIAGSCYFFVGNHKDAIRHFHRAWKINHDAFTPQEITDYYEACQKIGKIEGGLERAYKRIQGIEARENFNIKKKI